ncbi:MAG: zf-TFIIB domain-containing protein [Actinomycetota bacterium]|nr:zf-TFIIB domain-containing protein [Actinomycetota bacterium]
MNCPTDQTILQLAERQGIEIDYCPTCRGVWLDRGELDKLIERSAEFEAPVRPAGRWEGDDDDDDYRRGGRWEDDRDHGLGRPGRKKKRGSFLGELFEFGE